MLMERDTDDGSARAAALIDSILRPFGLGDSWAFHALHDDGRVLGMSERRAPRYRDAELIINLHGGTSRGRSSPRAAGSSTSRPTRCAADRAARRRPRRRSTFLEPHCAYFTFAENLGTPRLHAAGRASASRSARRASRSCSTSGRRRPAGGRRFTTVANWRQRWRDVRSTASATAGARTPSGSGSSTCRGRTGAAFELALSGYGRATRGAARATAGPCATRSTSTQRRLPRLHRGSARSSPSPRTRTCASRTGWFSDRSATYLAAGRPVVTQDTGFGAVLPTGEGLFAVRDLDEAAAAVEAIAADPARHRRAAAAIAREHFDAERVLGDLLDELDVRARNAGGRTMDARAHDRRPHRRATGLQPRLARCWR